MQNKNPNAQSSEDWIHKLEIIAEYSPGALAMFDKDMKYIWASKRWISDYRITKPVIGLSHYQVFPEISNEWKDVHKRCLAGASEKKDEDSFLRADGKTDWLRWEVRPWHELNGKIGGIIIFTEDITQMKNAFLELEKAKKEAETANVAKSTFLANMSHEIRTPLGVILGFSELMGSPNLTAEERESFSQIIRRNGALLLNIINDILDLSKIEAGKVSIELSQISVTDIVDNIKNVFSESLSKKKLPLNFNLDNDLPSFITSDKNRLNQILINIIGNAVKFTNSGRIDVTIRRHVEPSKNIIVFEVTDTGVGINKEKTEKLFNVFSQIDESCTREHGGSGLGLALSRQLARLLGGDIVLSKSEEGKGSTFTITILDRSVTEPVLARNIPEKPTLPKVTDKNVLNHLRILLTEDSSDNQFLFSRILKSAGAEIDIAGNGKEAVDKITQGKFYDLILMDLQMPVMDGYHAIEKIRSYGYKGPVIALTAHFMAGEKQKCLTSGFDNHISKPVEQNTLIRTIQETLSKK